MRIYDPRAGRFLSVDPITKQYPELTPYQFASNSPISAVDLDGLEAAVMTIPRNTNVNTSDVLKGYHEGVKKGTIGLITASDVNDAMVLTTWMTRGSNAINIDGSPATNWDKGLAVAGAVIPFVSGSLLKQSAKWGSRGAEWLYHASKGTKVADALLSRSALRKALGTTIKAGEEAHHIIPVQLLKEEKVVQDAVNAGFDFNGSVNGIAVKKYTKAGESVADGGIHATHPGYTEQIRGILNDFVAENKNYTPEQAKKFLEGFNEKVKGVIKKESIDGGKKINDIKLK